MKNIIFWGFISGFIGLVVAPSVLYAKESKSKYIDNFDLKPVIFDSENSTSSTLGLEYLINGKLLDVKFDSEETDEIDADVVIGGYDISYSLKGLAAESSENNPKNFSEVRFSANYFRSSSSTFKVGVFFKTESDQKFDDNQKVYGLTSTFAKIGGLTKNDIFALHVNLGQVDPSKDQIREAIIGSNLDTYDRIDVEALYIHNIGNDSLDTFEINYRYFVELGADNIIKNVGLDRFRLITYRLGFKNNLFVAYSSGELPFNQKENQIYEIGFSYKFE